LRNVLGTSIVEVALPAKRKTLPVTAIREVLPTGKATACVPGMIPAAPSVGPRTYVPSCSPISSFATVPEISSRRQ
jgi:hypothetical protein